MALDGPVDSESGSTYGDFLQDDNAIQPLEELSMRQLGHEARKLLDTLEPLEAKVLRMRFGIGNDTRHTLEQIGNEVGLTRERIRQIEIKALGKLKFEQSAWGCVPRAVFRLASGADCSVVVSLGEAQGAKPISVLIVDRAGSLSQKSCLGVKPVR